MDSRIGVKIMCPYWDIAFGANGEIKYLFSKQDNLTLIDYRQNKNSSIQFVHSTFSNADILNFISQYGKCGDKCPDWFLKDFGKGGLETIITKSATYVPRSQILYEVSPCVFSFKSIVNDTLQNLYGPPSYIYLIADLTQPKSLPITLRWINKKATRLPEAMWLSFKPVFTDAGKFIVNKVGQSIPAESVLQNGARHSHGHWGGVRYQSPLNATIWHLDSLDVGVVSLGLRSPFPSPLASPIDFTEGVHFLLWNNIWSTNFPLWYPFNSTDVDSEFRFNFSTL